MKSSTSELGLTTVFITLENTNKKIIKGEKIFCKTYICVIAVIHIILTKEKLKILPRETLKTFCNSEILV